MTILTAWLALAIFAAIAEILSPLFGYFFITAAALVAALAARLGLSVVVQIILFVIALLASLLLLRPRLLAKLGSRGVPSRTEALVGKTGIVTQAVDPEAGTGRVTVSGEDWAARSKTALALDTPVRIDGADGITLHVSPSDDTTVSPRSLP